MQEWISKNDISTNQLLARAVEKYISEEQILEAVEIRYASDEEVHQSARMMMKRHKRALEDLNYREK